MSETPKAKPIAKKVSLKKKAKSEGVSAAARRGVRVALAKKDPEGVQKIKELRDETRATLPLPEPRFRGKLLSKDIKASDWLLSRAELKTLAVVQKNSGIKKGTSGYVVALDIENGNHVKLVQKNLIDLKYQDLKKRVITVEGKPTNEYDLLKEKAKSLGIKEQSPEFGALLSDRLNNVGGWGSVLDETGKMDSPEAYIKKLDAILTERSDFFKAAKALDPKNPQQAVRDVADTLRYQRAKDKQKPPTQKEIRAAVKSAAKKGRTIAPPQTQRPDRYVPSPSSSGGGYTGGGYSPGRGRGGGGSGGGGGGRASTPVPSYRPSNMASYAPARKQGYSAPRSDWNRSSPERLGSIENQRRMKTFNVPTNIGRVTAPPRKLQKIKNIYDGLNVHKPKPMSNKMNARVTERFSKSIRLSKPRITEKDLKAEVEKRINFIEQRFPPSWHDVASQMVAKIETLEGMEDKVMGISAGENGKAMVSYPYEKGEDGKMKYKLQEMDIVTARNGYVGPGQKDYSGSGKTVVDRVMIATGGKVTPQGGDSSRGGSRTVKNAAIYFGDSDGGMQGTRGTHWHGASANRSRGYNQKSTLGCIVSAKPYEMDVAALETFKKGGVFYNVRENKELPKNVRRGDG